MLQRERGGERERGCYRERGGERERERESGIAVRKSAVCGVGGSFRNPCSWHWQIPCGENDVRPY